MDGIMIRVVFCVLSFWVGFLQATGEILDKPDAAFVLLR